MPAIEDVFNVGQCQQGPDILVGITPRNIVFVCSAGVQSEHILGRVDAEDWTGGGREVTVGV